MVRGPVEDGEEASEEGVPLWLSLGTQALQYNHRTQKYDERSRVLLRMGRRQVKKACLSGLAWVPGRCNIIIESVI
jgi:hypothetical protein